MKIVYYFLLAIVFTLIGWAGKTFWDLKYTSGVYQTISKGVINTPKPLEKYSIENLSTANIKPGKIEVNENKFIFEFSPDLSGKTKKVSGSINIPEGDGPFPIIVMFRGFIDQTIYKTGMGTVRVAEYFSKNGFITIAPDFLGYADSDKEAENIFESRFQTYVTAISLINSIKSISQFDNKNIFIWGHSNGGQIALTALEITRANYPTVLWAPVSKPFPYSILYYTDESADKGKFIRSELAKLEKDYDVEKYSLSNYLDRINAPIQIHQGTNDDAIPLKWTTNLDKVLNDSDLIIHTGADHDMRPVWDLAAAQSLQFYKKYLK